MDTFGWVLRAFVNAGGLVGGAYVIATQHDVRWSIWWMVAFAVILTHANNQFRGPK